MISITQGIIANNKKKRFNQFGQAFTKKLQQQQQQQ